ncbi:unnamed protein product, partial [marine sediment metagenome]
VRITQSGLQPNMRESLKELSEGGLTRAFNLTEN